MGRETDKHHPNMLVRVMLNSYRWTFARMAVVSFNKAILWKTVFMTFSVTNRRSSHCDVFLCRGSPISVMLAIIGSWVSINNCKACPFCFNSFLKTVQQLLTRKSCLSARFWTPETSRNIEIVTTSTFPNVGGCKSTPFQ